MRRGAGGIGTSAERARRVGRALGSNRFPFENHRRIRVACVGRRDHARLGDRDWARTATTDTSSISGATSASGHRRCSSPVDRGFSNGSSMARHSHAPRRRWCGCSALRGLSSTNSPLRRADERAAPRLFTCCARRYIPRPLNPTADAAAVQIPPSAAPRGWLCADTAASGGPREAATGGTWRGTEPNLDRPARR